MIYFAIAVMFTVLACTDKGEGIDPLPKETVVNFSASPLSIVYDGVYRGEVDDSTSKLTWNVDGEDIIEVTLNGKKVAAVGEMRTSMLTRDTVLTLSARTARGVDTVEKKVLVAVKPYVSAISKGIWKLVKIETWNESLQAWKDNGMINPCIADNTNQFQFNRKCWLISSPILCDPIEPAVTWSTWTFLEDGNKIRWGQDWAINELSDTQFIIEGNVPNNLGGTTRMRKSYRKG